MTQMQGIEIRWSEGPRGSQPPGLPPGAEDSRGAERGAQAVARVFVVEDEALIAMELTDRLSELGYEVCGTSGRGETALRRIVELRPDAVLMDIHLAGAISGVDVARLLREQYRVPVVFLTAYSDPALIARASAAGSYGFLVKPFDERELHATLQVAMARHAFDDQLSAVNASLEECVRERTVALERATRVAEDASRAKTDFLRNVSHELRTPLNHIVLLAELLSARPGIRSDRSAAMSVENITRSAFHLATMVEQILDLASTERAHVPLRMERLDVGAVVAEALELAGGLAAQNGITLETFTAVPCAVQVLADRERLRQVVLSLLSNAVKYNRPGGSVRLEILPAGDGTVAISVSDTGPGLTEGQRARVFEPFARFVPEGEVVGGIGLGLTVARDVTGMMGRRIDVESQPGEGSRFSVILSRLPAEERPVARGL